MQKQLINETHFLNIGKGTQVRFWRNSAFYILGNKSFFKRADFNIKVAFFFPRPCTQWFAQNQRILTVIWLNTTPKGSFLKHSPKGKLNITCKFHKMFGNSVNLCIMYYLVFLNSCLWQIANLATKCGFEILIQTSLSYFTFFLKGKKKKERHKREVKVIERFSL